MVLVSRPTPAPLSPSVLFFSHCFVSSRTRFVAASITMFPTVCRGPSCDGDAAHCHHRGCQHIFSLFSSISPIPLFSLFLSHCLFPCLFSLTVPLIFPLSLSLHLSLTLSDPPSFSSQSIDRGLESLVGSSAGWWIAEVSFAVPLCEVRDAVTHTDDGRGTGWRQIHPMDGVGGLSRVRLSARMLQEACCRML